MSNTITSVKNTQEGTSSRVTGVEEGISEQEDRNGGNNCWRAE